MKNIRRIFLPETARRLAQILALAGIVVFSAVPFSCQLTEEGVQLVGGDFSAPVLENLTVLDSTTLRLSFSEPVHLRGIVVSPHIPEISDADLVSYNQSLAPSLAAAAGEYGSIDVEARADEDGKNFTLIMSQATEIGKSYEVYGIAEDEVGNSLTFCIPFIGYNSMVPRVIITELQVKYAKGSSKGNTIYRGEYVEFLALEDGNLAGLVLESASDGRDKSYRFPAIEVSKGEVFLVHLRTVDEGCVNEDGDDLSLATAPHSAEGIRDLWSDNTTARLHDTADVIILRDTVHGVVMDAVMYAAPDSTEWKFAVGEYAIEASLSGVYASSQISSASSSMGLTPLKSLTRTNAAEIRDFVMADSGGDWDFPFKSDESTWVVEACTPGTL